MTNPYSFKRDGHIYVLMAALVIAVFIVDRLTRLGIADWVFYLIPIALCLLQKRVQLAFVLATVTSILTIAGYFMSPEGIDPTVVIVNRTFGIIAIWSVAFLVRRVLIERTRAQHLFWLQQGQAQVAQSMLGEQAVDELANNLLSAFARYVDAQIGRLYRLHGSELLPIGGFAFDGGDAASQPIAVGQGLIGQAVIERKPIVARDLPEGYIRVTSSLGSASPRELLILPLTAEGVLVGVLELGFLRSSDESKMELELGAIVAEDIGVAIRSALYRQRLQELLEETQRQSEELQSQQEELRVSNEELEEQGRVLRESQARLETQQAELEQSNIQLQEQTERLESQKKELLLVQRNLKDNAEELERANRYKSEFLANMSHELRTPLNSSLILSQLLADNKIGNLTDDQVRFAKTIRSANNDLLALINDILDLSKIEAGHVELHPEPIPLKELADTLHHVFDPIAKDKGLDFRIDQAVGLPDAMVTDSQRLRQIIKNLLSNAFKFTEAGEVSLSMGVAGPGRVCFAVSDTGIGIPESQQDIIFEAFRQADGTTSRKYGGTGLGLSISRQLAQRLGGEIRVRSEPGKGSVFTLELPVELDAAALIAPTPASAPAPLAPKAALPVPPNPKPVAEKAINPASLATAEEPGEIEDDRARRSRERLILVVEDDIRFARILYDLAHELNFDCIHAATGGEAIELARKLQPSGILLDVGLPDQSGLSVLERLKRDPLVRHIPIHILSVEDYTQTALELGAIGYALKPAAREELAEVIQKLEERLHKTLSHVLIVEDDPTLRENIGLLLKDGETQITAVGTVAEALEHVSNRTFDCMVMDLMLPDASGFELLEKMAEGDRYAFPPVIVYTGRALSRAEEERLRRYSKSIIIKGAKSPERLLDEVTLFLHRVENKLPPDQQKLLLQARQRDAVFEGRTILLAEDDVRNIFALSSVLEPLGAKLDIARNGREALTKLQRKPDIDLVLMDIMMPEMDGLTAMREIRKNEAWAKLPIIALTAKAMADDRQNCLEAGANDYIAKPIDVDKLISLCRVWMPK